MQGKMSSDEAHYKSQTIINPYQVTRDERWEGRRGRGKTRGKFSRKREKEIAECGNCKMITEVFCLQCATRIIELSKEHIESLDKKRKAETEESLRASELKVKELEKEIHDLKENSKIHQVKKSMMQLNHSKGKAIEAIKEEIQKDLICFSQEQEIWKTQIEKSYADAIDLFKTAIQSSLQNTRVEIFGSYSTGMLLPYSDIDLVVITESTSSTLTLKEVIPAIEGLDCINKIDKIFKATIPVLKIQSEILNQEIKIDITIQDQNHKGVEGTTLVKKFLKSYSTMKCVYLVLKQLMYYCNFHEPYKGGLSSYGLFLLIAFFYQENMGDWNFSNCDKKKQEAEILLWFFDFYIRFERNRFVVVEYEGFNSRDFRNKNSHSKLIVPDPLNPMHNVLHKLWQEKFTFIIETAYANISRQCYCECEDGSSIISRFLYETRYTILSYEV